MGGEGTLNSMIISLRNNKNLLLRRTTYFDRKYSHEELKRIYSQRVRLNEKSLTEAEKRKIREKIRGDLRRENRIKILIVVSCLILIPTIGYFAFSGFPLRSKSQESEISLNIPSKTYEESLHNGFINLNRNQPFFAIGHFENALKVRQNDELAIEKLIFSYEMLCSQNKNSCELAQAKIDSLRSVLR